MSIITIVCTEQGIVMASDSRLVGQNKLKDGIVEKFVVTDNAEKIFLIKNKTIGISYCGNSEIDNKYIGEFIKEFDKEEVEENDDIECIANKFLDYILKRNGDNTRCFICGYKNKEPYIFTLENNKMMRTNSNEGLYGLLYNGFSTPIEKIIKMEPKFDVNFSVMQLADAIDFSEFLIDLTIKYQVFKEKLATCGGPIDILVITKDYSKFIKHKILTK